MQSPRSSCRTIAVRESFRQRPSSTQAARVIAALSVVLQGVMGITVPSRSERWPCVLQVTGPAPTAHLNAGGKPYEVRRQKARLFSIKRMDSFCLYQFQETSSLTTLTRPMTHSTAQAFRVRKSKVQNRQRLTSMRY